MFDVGHVAEHGNDRTSWVDSLEFVKHLLGRVDSDDPQSRLCQWEGEPSGSDPEFENGTRGGKPGQRVDCSISIEGVCIPTVVHVRE